MKNVAEVAETIGVSTNTVRNWARLCTIWVEGLLREITTFGLCLQNKQRPHQNGDVCQFKALPPVLEKSPQIALSGSSCETYKVELSLRLAK